MYISYWFCFFITNIDFGTRIYNYILVTKNVDVALELEKRWRLKEF